MGNTIPKKTGKVIDLGTEMESGLSQYILDLKTTKLTLVDFQSQLADFIAQDASYNEAAGVRQTLSDAHQAAMDAVASWLQVTKGVLTGRFGNRWSAEWRQAGWITPTLELPENNSDRLALVVRLVGFFNANLNYQVASMDVTAGKGTSLRDTAIAARNVLEGADVVLQTAAQTRQTAYTTLTTSMRDVIKLVGMAFGPDDPRWEAFGLNKPSTKTTPGKPEGLTVSLDPNGGLVLQCGAVPLADRYRWRMLVVGPDERYRLAARSSAPMAGISQVGPGQTVQIIVQAVNATGSQGVASDPVRFTVPLPNKAADAETTALGSPRSNAVEEVVISSNGNGNGTNGHTNGRLPALG